LPARTLRNRDVLLKFWVGISIQIFALCQVLEEPLLGWIPHAVFGNWLSRIWGVLSVFFYVKWLLQIKKWNEAYETKSDKTVARIFHPLMAPAMGSVVVMEVVTFARSLDFLRVTVSNQNLPVAVGSCPVGCEACFEFQESVRWCACLGKVPLPELSLSS